jgi:hypothetical protein
MKSYSRGKKGSLFAAWFFVSIGIFLLVIGIRGMVDELKLRSGGTVIQAKVTDWRLHHGKYGINYDVCYTFHVPGKLEPHTTLWTAIPQPLWEETKNTRF